MNPVFFPSAEAFRDWLHQHAAASAGVTVGFYKVGSGRPSLTWPESVDEALCVGWIDGIRRRLDAQAYQIRFTPRRAGSNWSAVNVRRAQALIAAGRMQPAGLAAFERRRAERTGVYSYEGGREAALTRAEIREFKRHARAWARFETAAPSCRRAWLHWVTSAKRPETRRRRLERVMRDCADEVRAAAQRGRQA